MRVDQPAPEALVLAAVEVFELDALLLDPRVVAEIEDALAVDVRELEHVIVGDALQVPAEDLAGVHLVEAVGIAAAAVGRALAAVQSPRCRSRRS